MYIIRVVDVAELADIMMVGIERTRKLSRISENRRIFRDNLEVC